MASPGRKDLQIYQGDRFFLSIYFLDGTTNGSTGPLDITNLVFKAQIRAKSADADDGNPPLAEFTCLNQGDGLVEISLENDQTAALTLYSSHWDLQAMDSSGNITTFLAGKAFVTSEITR
jgi:hypothetical protein